MELLSAIRAGTKAVPAVRYALGVAAVVAAVALAVSFVGDFRVGIFGTVIMFGMMFLLLVFAVAVANAGPKLVMPALFATWAFVILTLSTAGLLVTSFFFHWPQPAAKILGLEATSAIADSANEREGMADTDPGSNVPTDEGARVAESPATQPEDWPPRFVNVSAVFRTPSNGFEKTETFELRWPEAGEEVRDEFHVNAPHRPDSSQRDWKDIGACRLSSDGMLRAEVSDAVSKEIEIGAGRAITRDTFPTATASQDPSEVLCEVTGVVF